MNRWTELCINNPLQAYIYLAIAFVVLLSIYGVIEPRLMKAATKNKKVRRG